MSLFSLFYCYFVLLFCLFRFVPVSVLVVVGGGGGGAAVVVVVVVVVVVLAVAAASNVALSASLRCFADWLITAHSDSSLSLVYFGYSLVYRLFGSYL